MTNTLRFCSCSFFVPSLGGVAVYLFFCLVLPSFSCFGWSFFSPCLLLRGAAWSLPSVGGVVFLPPPLGGAAFSPVFCWVVLLGLLLLFSVMLLFFLLLFLWCCLPPPLGETTPVWDDLGWLVWFGFCLVIVWSSLGQCGPMWARLLFLGRFEWV